MTRIELETKSDRELLLLVAERVNAICEQVESQNGRIRALESWRNWQAGAIAVLGFVVIVLVNLLLSKLT